MMISREEASKVAGAHGKVSKVLSLEEIDFRPPLIYNFSSDDLKNCWIAYLDQGMPFTLQESHIVLVSKEDGRIAYAGSAGDEG